jgi:hypothetical protein
LNWIAKPLKLGAAGSLTILRRRVEKEQKYVEMRDPFLPELIRLALEQLVN